MSEETVVTYELGVALLGKTRNAPHTNMITNASLIFLPPAFLVCRCDKLRSLRPSRHLSEDSRARDRSHNRPPPPGVTAIGATLIHPNKPRPPEAR
jgi:hypothetical protein